MALGVAAPLVRRRLKLPPPVVSVLAWQAPLAVAVALPRTRVRDALVYTAQMWAYLAHYEMPHDDPGALRARVKVRYPIRGDAWLGLGEVPTVRLQRALGRPGEVLPHDIVLSWVHWVWFLVPHGTLAYILLLHPDRFERSAALMAGVFDVGLVFYWALPTAPPWWAGREGHLPPVRRIMVETGERFWKRLWRRLYDSLAGNPFAAMPSLHFATSVMGARVLADVGRGPGTLGWSYAGLLGFALVYLGEHYVVDLLAGLALAEGVRRGAPLGAPAVRTVSRGLQRLEARAA